MYQDQLQRFDMKSSSNSYQTGSLQSTGDHISIHI